MMDFCESRRLYENGLAYGEQILRYDRARERTHRKLMRLFYLAGDRTAALRHYEKCVAALREELGVEPAKRTRLLYRQIEADQLDEPAQPLAQAGQDAEQNDPLLRVFNHLGAFQESLNRLQAQLSKDILAFQKEIKRRN
jgi:DNA-binding SARP family transcriptional activator